jgi:hypothetical protein
LSPAADRVRALGTKIHIFTPPPPRIIIIIIIIVTIIIPLEIFAVPISYAV